MKFMSRMLMLLKLATTASIIILAGILLWPGALAAVTSFTLLGVSIASLVGPGFFSQLFAIPILTTGAFLATGLLIDLGISICQGIAFCCKSSPGSKRGGDLIPDTEETSDITMQRLGAPAPAPDPHKNWTHPEATPTLMGRAPQAAAASAAEYNSTYTP